MSESSTNSRCPDPDRLAAVALTQATGVGLATTRQLLGVFGTPRRVLDEGLPPKVASEALGRAVRCLEDADRIGATCIVQGDAGYPAPLRELEDPPLAIWSLGDVPGAIAMPAIAVVGTRQSTGYGERVTRNLVTALVREGVSIVSGLARGIDAAAHRAALDAGGRTVGVLGTGVDVVYPVGHRELQAAVERSGAVLSENPPGMRADPGCFPRRNRLIAALASATIVIEAGAKSGAIGTVEHALALGREVGAVPGPIDSAQSEGSNQLMRDGAIPITSAADALSLIGLSAPGPAVVHIDDLVQRRLWEALAKPSPTLDLLCTRAGLPVREGMSAVTALELRGLIECGLTGEIRRRG